MATPNPVNLLGPNPALPLDLQTQEAQIQYAQQLAQALLQQGLTPGKPGFMAGEGPFARYVPDVAGPIARIVNAYMGGQALQGTQQQQLDLARAAQARSQQDWQNVMAPVPVQPDAARGPIDETIGPLVRGPTGIEMANRAAMATDPTVKALATTLLAKQMDIEGKRVMTPEAYAAAVRAGMTPGAVQAATTTGPLTGGPIFNPYGPAPALQDKPVTQGPMEQINRFNPVVTPPAAPPSDGGTTPPTAPAAGSTSAAPGGMAVASPANPQVKVNAEEAPKLLEELKGSYGDAMKAAKTAPQLGYMLNMVDRFIQSGVGGPVEPLKQALISTLKGIGLSIPDMSRVTDMQTFIANGLLPAMQSIHDNYTSRGTQQELSSAQQSVGANETMQPTAMMRVINEQLANALNVVQLHREQLDQAAQNPYAVQGAQKYNINFTPESLLGGSIPEAKTPGSQGTVSLQLNNNTNRWVANMDAFSAMEKRVADAAIAAEAAKKAGRTAGPTKGATTPPLGVTWTTDADGQLVPSTQAPQGGGKSWTGTIRQ